MKYFCTSAAGLIADITPDPTLQNVLAGSALLYGGLKDVSTFYQHAMINHSYIEGLIVLWTAVCKSAWN